MIVRSILSGLTLALAFLLLPASADAAEGYARTSGVLRAGPSSDYPEVASVSRGDSLEVYGCLNRTTWCDVSVDGDRGWLPGGRIEFLRDGHRERLSGDMALFGLSVLTFGQDAYWGEHYRDRPWVGDRRWNRGRDRSPAAGPRPDRQRPAVSQQQQRAPSAATSTPARPARHVATPARPAHAVTPRKSATPRARPAAPAAQHRSAPARAAAPRREPATQYPRAPAAGNGR